MNVSKNSKNRLFAIVIVVVMVVTLMSAALVLNAGAINPNMLVSSHGTEDNSVLPTTLQPGQVWTGKIVTDPDTDFGDGSNGQFGVTLVAVGGSFGEGYLITEKGLTITDTFDEDYDFIISGTSMTFYLEGVTPQTADMSSGTFTYTSPSNEVIVFDRTTRTITYTIPATALKTVTANDSILTDATLNTLKYGLVLKDSATTATTYKTNPPYCTNTFTATMYNPYYHTPSESVTYINEPASKGWIDYNPFIAIRYEYIKDAPDGPIFQVKWMNLDDKYWFTYPGMIGYNDVAETGTTTYLTWIKNGEYTMSDGQKYMFFTSPNDDYFISLDAATGLIKILGTAKQWGTIDAVIRFTINTLPTGPDTFASISAGSNTYNGDVKSSFFDSDHWSFTTDDGTIVSLLNATTLTVEKPGEWIDGRSISGTVDQTLYAYGYVTLTAPYTPPVIPTSSLTVSKSVTGEGASTSEKFAITVTFTPGGTNNWNVLGIVPPAGATGGNGVYTLSLSASDGPVTFTNIPIDTTYVVTETMTEAQAADNWTAGTSTNTSGSITENGVNAVVVNEHAQVLGTSDVTSPSPSSGVLAENDKEVLPQTDGISISTIIGVFGLAIIAVGGTAFVIFRKKFLN